MHYGSLRFANSSDRPVMLHKNGSYIQELNDKTRLSDLDIEGMSLLYACSHARIPTNLAILTCIFVFMTIFVL